LAGAEIESGDFLHFCLIVRVYPDPDEGGKFLKFLDQGGRVE